MSKKDSKNVTRDSGKIITENERPYKKSYIPETGEKDTPPPPPPTEKKK